jgi:hypothetical protein
MQLRISDQYASDLQDYAVSDSCLVADCMNSTLDPSHSLLHQYFSDANDAIDAIDASFRVSQNWRAPLELYDSTSNHNEGLS